ncbi:hypothetical protein CLU95_4617 [Variovorax sp. 54]|uniref:hypothetical protein n=1 Tax=Variovorax sp. 54 TaxID=2035212 RepID=UPI000C1756D6|nr:hypothetical protein [Variovorax sp. 54]PIF77443.1 hypothetical protein CLU95_4617 [Variovorax sp. 54]
MNDLLIVYIGGGRWVARVTNTGIEYPFRFLAEQPDLSELCVQSLALAMQSGREQVIQSIAGNGIFDLPRGVQPEAVVSDLFDATQTMIVGEAEVFVAETVLSEELEGAGQALLAAMA